MEAKKTIHADLQNKSFLFFNIGLVVSLTLVLLAFNYRVYDTPDNKDLTKVNVTLEESFEPPVTEHVPPPVPQLTQPQIVEVSNETEIEEDLKINMDIETHIDERIAEVVPVAPVIEEEKEDPHEIFLVVEETAEPVGGLEAFYSFVREKLKYPAPAKRMDIEGKVFVQFVVEKDGSISNVQFVKGIGGGCDEEAVRIVSMAPKWNPAKQRGKPVRQRMVLPITFKLAQRM